MKLLVEILSSAKPRVIEANVVPQTILVFSDGACENGGDIATCGAIVFDPNADERFWFSFLIPEWLVFNWQRHGAKQQVIAEAELLPIIIARQLICRSQVLKLVIHFVDNDGVSDALIAGFSRVVSLQSLLRRFVLQECEFKFASWISRVASHANPADAPSRMAKEFLTEDLRGRDLSCEAGRVFDELAEELTLV
jgi:hypothetical protein